MFLDIVIPRLVSEAPSDKKLISGSIRIAPSRTVISHNKVFILGPDFCPIYCFWLALWGGRNQQIPFVVVVVLIFVCWFALGFALFCFFKTRRLFVALAVLASLELRDPPAFASRVLGLKACSLLTTAELTVNSYFPGNSSFCISGIRLGTFPMLGNLCNKLKPQTGFGPKPSRMLCTCTAGVEEDLSRLLHKALYKEALLSSPISYQKQIRSEELVTRPGSDSSKATAPSTQLNCLSLCC